MFTKIVYMNVHPELILYLESKEDALVLRLIYMVLYFDMEGVSSSEKGCRRTVAPRETVSHDGLERSSSA